MLFRKSVIASFIIAPLSIIIERYLTPIIIAIVLSGIQAGTVTLESTIWLIVLYGFLQIISQLVGYRLNLYAMWSVQIKGAREVYRESYEKLSKNSLNFYSDNFAGALVSKVTKFGTAFVTFWFMMIFQVLFIVTSILATVIGIAFMIWQYALILLILVVVFTITAYLGTRFMRPRQKERSKAYTRISAQLADSISNMFAVKIDSGEMREKQRLEKSLDNMVEKEFYVRKGIISISSIYTAILVFMRIVTLVVAIWAVQEGIADAAIVYLCITYTFNLLQEVWNISNVMRDLYQIVGDSEEMLDILDQDIDIKDKTKKAIKVSEGALELKNVSFTHANDNHALFENFQLSVKPGQRIGVVGVSGAGKTTLTKLLLRFVDPTSGSVMIDGQNIARYTQASVHDAIAYVPQEPLLFHRSISENIGYGRPDATQEEIENAARQANALSFISSLPDGFDTLVGERGVKLSGGQRQRVAIARAILKDAPVLVLDEATSALDSESEKLIQDALQKLMKGRTSIVIAHRLSTIANLDRIIVLENGKIIEDGTHAKLLKQDKVYAMLWAHQSGGFIEE